MACFAVATYKNTRRGIGLLDGGEVRDEFAITDRLALDVGHTGFIDGDVDQILFRFGSGNSRGGQVHLDVPLVHHAQAHQHKCGEQKEHDIDQRNDLDARLVFGRQRGAKLYRHMSDLYGAGGTAVLAREGFDVVAMLAGALNDQFRVIDRALQAGAKVSDAAIKIIVRKQAEDCDAEPAGGGDERFGDATTDLGGSELFVAHKVKRMHDAGDGAEEAEQRR